MNTANPDPSLGRNQLPNGAQEHNQQEKRKKEVRRVVADNAPGTVTYDTESDEGNDLKEGQQQPRP
jgi:hypothetical protein